MKASDIMFAVKPMIEAGDPGEQISAYTAVRSNRLSIEFDIDLDLAKAIAIDSHLLAALLVAAAVSKNYYHRAIPASLSYTNRWLLLAKVLNINSAKMKSVLIDALSHSLEDVVQGLKEGDILP